MTRLLFAAARGARIQRQQEAMSPARRNWWTDVDIQWGMDDELRIHPADEHLQYGPVSTALRESAPNPWSSEGTWAVPHGMFWMDLHAWLCRDEYRDELHRSLFLLILAEALADEGL